MENHHFDPMRSHGKSSCKCQKKKIPVENLNHHEMPINPIKSPFFSKKIPVESPQNPMDIPPSKIHRGEFASVSSRTSAGSPSPAWTRSMTWLGWLGWWPWISLKHYVYIYIYIHIYIYIYIYVNLCMSICIYLYIYINIHRLTYIHIQTMLRGYECIYVCVYIYIERER